MNTKKLASIFIMLIVAGVFAYAKTYTITINMSGDDQGTISCPEMGISETCWYQKGTPLQPTRSGERITYNGTLTNMDKKGHKSIYLFGNYFIHPGSNPEDSDGCIVFRGMRTLFDKLQSDNPKNLNGDSGNTIRVVISR
jgi:hypothetical protein